MRLKSLQALRAVMETGSVTEGARHLRRTQPQVSRLIASLESEIGFRLFLRQGRRLIPTREGTSFYQEAKRILSGLDEVSRIADDIRTAKDAWVRILAQPYLAHALLPAALASLAECHPHVRCSLEIRSRGDLGHWVAGQQFDLGIAALPIDVPALRSVPFASVSVVAVLPKGHRLARKRSLTVEDIAAEPFIGLKPFTLLGHDLNELFGKMGLPLSLRAETASGLSACQLVAQGMGITLADPLVAQCVSQDRVTIRTWEPGFTLTYGFLFPISVAPSELTLEFARIAARSAAELQPRHVKLLPFA